MWVKYFLSILDLLKLFLFKTVVAVMIETEATAEDETSEVAAVVEDAAGDVDVVAVEVPIKKLKYSTGNV